VLRIKRCVKPATSEPTFNEVAYLLNRLVDILFSRSSSCNIGKHYLIIYLLSTRAEHFTKRKYKKNKTGKMSFNFLLKYI